MRSTEKIPIKIHPLFWLTSALIGYIISHSFLGTVIWMFIILISVLVHEMGHALTARFFGLSPRIDLVALGGLTAHQGDTLPFWKQFFIVFNGPLFGFLLFLLTWSLLKVPMLSTGLWGYIFTSFYQVNLIWTILNMIPVIPLDGGQLLRVLLEAFFGAKGLRYSLLIGTLIGAILTVALFLYHSFFLGALFFLFSFQSWDTFRRLKPLVDKDRTDTTLKKMLEQAEKDLQTGQKDKALFAFDRIRQEAKEGMIYITATQYLAFLKYDLGKNKETYELLQSIQVHLSPEGLCLLHRVGFELKEYALVESMGGECFQLLPSKEIALRNALACAALAKAQPAVGWLETAFQSGLDNISEILKQHEFDTIRESEYLKQFIKNHS